MILYPAIDLRKGQAVRLFQGDPDAATVFSDDPVATAERWLSEGAEWLHVVNLDGALSEASDNPRLVREIARAVPIPVQFGGGLRSLADVEVALALGVARVMLGTLAVSDPALLVEAVRRFGAERIVVCIDAREGRVATKGWQEESDLTVLEVAERVKGAGVERVVYTDILRDGTLGGPDMARTRELGRRVGLRVIASGGVGSLDDLRRLRALEPDGVEGVIVGKALYGGAVSLAEALRVLK